MSCKRSEFRFPSCSIQGSCYHSDAQVLVLQAELRISSADLLRVTDHPTFYISVSKLLVCEHFIYLYGEFSVILIDLSSFKCFIFCSYKEFLTSKTIAQVTRRYRRRYGKQFASPVTKYIYNDYKILSHERFGKRMLPGVF